MTRVAGARALRACVVLCMVVLGGCGGKREVTQEGAHVGSAPRDSESVDAAVDVVRSYYAAIEARSYRTAYRLWEGEGTASGQSYDQFVAGFAHTRHVTAELGAPGGMGAAAGSRYVEVPVTIRATTDRDETQRFAGSLVVRRAVVDGASEAQRHWHLYSADVQRLP